MECDERIYMPQPSIESVIGDNVARFRESRGWKQSELGAAMERATGKRWERGSVWAAENGKRSFAVSDLLGLADALGVQVADLLQVPGAVTVGSSEFEPDKISRLLGSGESSERVISLGPETFSHAVDIQDVIHRLRISYDRLIVRCRLAAKNDADFAEWLRDRLDEATRAQSAKIASAQKLEPGSARVAELVALNMTPMMQAAHDALRDIDGGMNGAIQQVVDDAVRRGMAGDSADDALSDQLPEQGYV